LRADWTGRAGRTCCAGRTSRPGDACIAFIALLSCRAGGTGRPFKAAAER
jgi:hypothetical protein